MTSSPPSKLPATVGALLRRRLREVNRSREQLAEALEVPAGYLDELMSGTRRPPLPGRTDIYEKMTSFLRLGRNDLAACASAERADAARAAIPAPEPSTCASPERRGRSSGAARSEGAPSWRGSSNACST